jgi:hypothetical protein
VAATQETNFPRPHPTRIADCGLAIEDSTFVTPIRNPQSAIRNPQLDFIDDLLWPSVQSFKAVGAHEHPPQLHGLDDGAHGDERRDEPRELLVVVHRIGLAQLERGTKSDRLADRHARLHPRAPGERRDLPHPWGADGVGCEQRHGERREFGPSRQFGAQREQRNPAACGGIARQVGHPGH